MGNINLCEKCGGTSNKGNVNFNYCSLKVKLKICSCGEVNVIGEYPEALKNLIREEYKIYHEQNLKKSIKDIDIKLNLQEILKENLIDINMLASLLNIKKATLEKQLEDATMSIFNVALVSILTNKKIQDLIVINRKSDESKEESLIK